MDREVLRQQLAEQDPLTQELQQAFDELAANLNGGNPEQVEESTRKFREKGHRFALSRYNSVTKRRKLLYQPDGKFEGAAWLAAAKVTEKITVEVCAGRIIPFYRVCSRIFHRFADELKDDQPLSHISSGRIGPMPVSLTPGGEEIEVEYPDPRVDSVDDFLSEIAQRNKLTRIWFDTEERRSFEPYLIGSGKLLPRLFEIVGSAINDDSIDTPKKLRRKLHEDCRQAFYPDQEDIDEVIDKIYALIHRLKKLIARFLKDKH
jgi:hypothetical protein